MKRPKRKRVEAVKAWAFINRAGCLTCSCTFATALLKGKDGPLGFPVRIIRESDYRRLVRQAREE